VSARDDWVERARAERIENVIAERGILLKGNDKSRCGPCPVCGGTDRFWINTKKQAWGCRKCDIGGDVIALVEHLDGVDFKTAVTTLTRDGPRPAPAAVEPTSGGKDEKSEYALQIWRDIWRNAKTAAGTLVEVYLRSRGITIPPPPSSRFAPRLFHRSKTGTVTYWPGMVALVQRGADGAPIAVHRTYLSPAGSKAPVDEVKKALAPTAGGAVRLAPATDFLMVGEGIETCLAAMQATGLPAWAALSTSGLKKLDLPEHVRRITILADGDEDGERAAHRAGARWLAEGREVRIARPPDGCDFNDLIAGSGR
jgi:putative DNA primase/helicase